MDDKKYLQVVLAQTDWNAYPGGPIEADLRAKAHAGALEWAEKAYYEHLVEELGPQIEPLLEAERVRVADLEQQVKDGEAALAGARRESESVTAEWKSMGAEEKWKRPEVGEALGRTNLANNTADQNLQNCKNELVVARRCLGNMERLYQHFCKVKPPAEVA